MNPDGRRVEPGRLVAIRPESAEHEAPSISPDSLDAVTQTSRKTRRVQGEHS